MTDEKKLLILQRALEQLQEEDPSKPSKPSREVYESLSRVCGTSADDLEDLWDNKDFKEEEKVIMIACVGLTFLKDKPSCKMSLKINPSIDDQKSIWPEDRSLGLLGSHHSLFCPRCYV